MQLVRDLTSATSYLSYTSGLLIDFSHLHKMWIFSTFSYFFNVESVKHEIEFSKWYQRENSIVNWATCYFNQFSFLSSLFFCSSYLIVFLCFKKYNCILENKFSGLYFYRSSYHSMIFSAVVILSDNKNDSLLLILFGRLLFSACLQ